MKSLHCSITSKFIPASVHKFIRSRCFDNETRVRLSWKYRIIVRNYIIILIYELLWFSVIPPKIALRLLTHKKLEVSVKWPVNDHNWWISIISRFGEFRGWKLWTFKSFCRRGAVVKRVEHISTIVLVNIWVARVRVPLVLSVGIWIWKNSTINT